MKTLEGTAKTTGMILKEEIKKSFWAKLGYVLFMRKTFKNYANRLNPNKVGGAMVVGVNSPIVKAHGAADGPVLHREDHLHQVSQPGSPSSPPSCPALDPLLTPDVPPGDKR